TLGAMGGFTLPVLFGLAVDFIGIHTACFMMLYGILAICMVAMHFAIRSERREKLLQQAIANNFLNR
ncbi:MAG: hypothetical protein R3208_15390, partial [Ketobacteraceae bacterium]|nr:hypothetical protein [Ketobacteraceae bacterium]